MCARPCAGRWHRVSGCLKQIDAGDMEVWGVAHDGSVWKRPINSAWGSWTYVPGASLKHVSASGKGYLWGVTAQNHVYKCKKPCNGHWAYLAGLMKQVDGGQAYVYAINPSNQVYRKRIDGTGSWYHISGSSCKQITGSARDYVWAIKTNGYIYKCKKPCTGSWSFFHSNIKYADGAVDGVGLTTPGHYTYLYTTPYY